MKVEIVRTPAGTYITPAPNASPITSGNDILDLMGATYEADSSNLLFQAAHLDPLFFELESGLAGEIFLKLNNYQLKAAFVVDIVGIKSQRFHELMREANHGNEINFYATTDEATNWLLA